MGNAEPDALRATFAEQARALVAGGVDLLNIETMFDLTEATIAVEAAVAAADGRPVLASMTFKPAAKGFRTMMGVSPEAAVKALKDAGADLVGCNCEITAEPMADLVPIMAELGGGRHVRPAERRPAAPRGRRDRLRGDAGALRRRGGDVSGARRAGRRRVLRHAARLHRRARRGPGPLAAARPPRSASRAGAGSRSPSQRTGAA